jgi:hypothetical protein
VYEYFEELDEMNWSARGNVLNQYLRNTSIGTTVGVTSPSDFNRSRTRNNYEIIFYNHAKTFFALGWFSMSI